MALRTLATWLLAAALVTVSSGCGGAALYAGILPGAEASVRELERVYVITREGDERAVDEHIRDELRAMGVDADSGLGPAPEGYDAFVTYIDRYTWDTTTFCIQLTLYVHDAENAMIVATGNSFRPSLIRETAAGHARLILQEILGGRS